MLGLPAVWRGWVLALLLAGCSLPRERPGGGGAHPAGWSDVANPSHPDFHGQWLRANGDRLDECRSCHGQDYAGGAVGVSCTSSSCHASPGGPEFCGTCHGDSTGARPATGAHTAHAPFCDTCHVVPSQLVAAGHIDTRGTVDVRFAGVATIGGRSPTWDPAAGTCSNTYCHGVPPSPPWPTGTADCTSCHGEPPASHARFADRAMPGQCANCHPVPPDAPEHVSGTIDLTLAVRCDTCHGAGSLGAPPPALDGTVDPTLRGSGAHRRHLDSTLADRIGRVVACVACHRVPSTPLDPGHIDEAAPADVRPFDGTYDASAASCLTGCHWNRSPGPVWTDASGGARACGACHEFPPLRTRTGAPHPSVLPDIAVCLGCHAFDPASHVDGTVNF